MNTAAATNNGIPLASLITGGQETMLKEVNKIPKPDGGLNGHGTPRLVTKNGHEIIPTQEAGWMVRADRKITEPSGLSKATAWVVIPIVASVITLVFTVGGYLVTFGRDDGRIREQQLQNSSAMQEIKDGQKRMEDRFNKIDDRLREQERFQDRMISAQGGFQAAQEDKK